MLNEEELLIKLMQLLDIDMKDIKLKQSSEKKRFITQEESNQKYQEHIQLIFDALNIDEQNTELVDIFQELLFLYISIYQKLLEYQTEANTKKINWIILKRLVIPFLAYKFANLDVDYDKRIDKNMPGGIFWYLPNTEDPNNIKMPIEYLMNWWLDLYGKGLDSLCNEIDHMRINKLDNEWNTEDDNNSKVQEAKNILNPWKYKGKIPNHKSLQLYLDNDLNYTGVFSPTNTIAIQPVYVEALKFVQDIKKLSLEELKKELPNETLLTDIYSSDNISVVSKKEFMKYVKERWSIPGRRELVTKFLIARAVQDVYRRLIEYFEFDDSNDIEENKILQLVYQYNVLYNIEMDRSKGKPINAPILDELYYEMIQPFYNPIDEIISTLTGDITIELANPNSEETMLEDTYLLKKIIFLTHKDNRFEKAFEESEIFHNYFHNEYNAIDEKVKYYQRLDNKTFFDALSGEENFQILLNLFIQNQSENYLKAEKVCSQMAKIAKNIAEEIQALSKFTNLYCDISHQGNQSKYNEAKHLLEQLISLLESQNNPVMASEKDILFVKANFYLKAKEFHESLKYYDKFFDLYVDQQKKEHFSDKMVLLAAYSAYTVKDKIKLKKYNKYLKKHNFIEFKTQKFLSFPIYFYN